MSFLVGAGEGEAVSERVTVKVDREELVLTESHYPPGESGPGPHIHRRHADCFYVLAGRLLFELAGERVELGAGGFALVPPGVVHTFRNEDIEKAHFLNAHAPGCNFAAHLRGEDVDFDTEDPPSDGGRAAADALLVPPGGGDELAVGGSRALLKAEGGDALGSVSLNEVTLAPGFPGPVLHLHETFTDSFWLLEGRLALRLGEETLEARAGDYAVAAPGTVHTFANPFGEPAQLLNLMAPGGFEQYLKEIAAKLEPGQPPDPEEMARVAARYDFRPADAGG